MKIPISFNTTKANHQIVVDEYLLPLFFKIQNQINEIKAHKLTIEPFFESIKNWVMEIQAGSLDFSSEKPRLPAWISYSLSNPFF